MSDSDLEVLEVPLDQDDVMDDLRDVIIQRRNEAVEQPERVASFELPSVLVEGVKPGKTGVLDLTSIPSQSTKTKSRASHRKNRMSRADRCRQARSRREKFNIPERKAKPYSTKEGRAEGRKRQREEKRARDKVIRSYYGEPEPEFEDNRDLPKESVFSNPGLPADFNDTADDDEDYEQKFSEPEHEDDYSYVSKKYQVKSEVHIPNPTEKPVWKSIRPLEIAAMNLARKTSH